MALLELKNIDAGYGRMQILHQVTLDVKEKEVVCVIGPNGAGKSTTFKVIMGFINYLGGEFQFEGNDIVGKRPDQILGLGLGYVPQGRIVFNQMSVRENLEMGAYLRQDKNSVKKDLEKIYAFFPKLKERSNQAGITLSGGEQQMLAIGRGLMSDPKLMLLDEMSLGLAPIICTELYKALKEISQRRITVLFVEQNVRRSLEEADRAYIIESGRLVLSGTAKDLREEEKVKKAYFGL